MYIKRNMWDKKAVCSSDIHPILLIICIMKFTFIFSLVTCTPVWYISCFSLFDLKLKQKFLRSRRWRVRKYLLFITNHICCLLRKLQSCKIVKKKHLSNYTTKFAKANTSMTTIFVFFYTKLYPTTDKSTDIQQLLLYLCCYCCHCCYAYADCLIANLGHGWKKKRCKVGHEYCFTHVQVYFEFLLIYIFVLFFVFAC